MMIKRYGLLLFAVAGAVTASCEGTTSEGEGEASEGEGDVIAGEGEGDVVAEGEGDVVAGEGEGDVVAGEGEGDVVAGEGEGDVVAGEGEGEGDVDPPILSAPSKGGSVAVDGAGAIVAAANKATSDVTLWDAVTLAERGRVQVGEEPVSLIFSPAGDALYVVNRRSATVTEVTGVGDASPTAARSVAVGAEPGQAALSPTGARLYVSSWVDGTVAVINTATMQVTNTIDVGGAPYAVCMSNNGDANDDDETVFVTDFYAHAVVTGPAEGDDTSREGRVFRINASDLSVLTSRLAPLAEAGIPGFEGSGAFPNQLYSCVVNEGFVYVTSVGASPEAFNLTTDFHQNLQGLVSVLDADTGAELTTDSVSINALVEQLGEPQRFVPVPIDIAFDSDGGSWVASMLADALVRIDWNTAPVSAGTAHGSFVQTSEMPTGLAISGTRAFVYNEVARALTVVDLAAETTQTLQAAPLPTDPQELAILRGQRSFNTGLGRFGDKGWVGCAGCHAFGTTDNVTWSFPTGPRQSTDTSATFDATGNVHRVQNWTAVFDEISDVEGNTRGVAGGTGAIVSTDVLNADGTANTAAQIALGANGGNLGSSLAIAKAGARPDDWSDVEAFMKTIRSPRGRASDEATAGRAVFEAAKCQNCHGGPLWTLSERYYEPVANSNFTTLSLLSQGITDIGEVRPEQLKTSDTSQLLVLSNDGNGGGARHTCVVRKVGSFANVGPQGRGASELRQNGTAAQGVDGFSVPSLLNIGMGAPYLHNGAAETLEELLDPNGAFVTHLQAGDAAFAPTTAEVQQLIAFLRSIDEETPTIPVPAGQRLCPTSVTP